MAPEDGLEPSKRHAQTSGRDSPAFNFRHSGIGNDSELLTEERSWMTSVSLSMDDDFQPSL